MVDVDGARKAVDLAEPLEHLDAVTGAAEHARDRLADGAVADDRDVELVVHPQAPTARCPASDDQDWDFLAHVSSSGHSSTDWSARYRTDLNVELQSCRYDPLDGGENGGDAEQPWANDASRPLVV